MLADLKKYKIHYSLLALIASGYLLVVIKYETKPLYVMAATGVFAAFYFLWGIFHHLKTGPFYGKVVLEYFLVAVLAVALVSLLLV